MAFGMGKAVVSSDFAGEILRAAGIAAIFLGIFAVAEAWRLLAHPPPEWTRKLVHFGGGVSGHIKLVPQFLDWVEEGYRVYCDTTWTIGFGARWLMTEIERRGVGEDRVLFASDEPWSDFWSEYWKINGAPVSDELKQRILYRNFEELYGEKR